MKPVFFAALALSIASTGCRSSITEPFALEWRGADTSPSASKAVTEGLALHSLRIVPFVDRRLEPTVVGSDDDSKAVYRSTSNVADFCTKVFASMFAVSGARVVDAGETATVRAEIILFNVTEGGMYNGQVVIRVFVVTNDGRTIWTGQVEGKSKRWGRSHSTDNINEALSNSLAEATKKLVNDDSLGKALVANRP